MTRLTGGLTSRRSPERGAIEGRRPFSQQTAGEIPTTDVRFPKACRERDFPCGSARREKHGTHRPANGVARRRVTGTEGAGSTSRRSRPVECPVSPTRERGTTVWPGRGRGATDSDKNASRPAFGRFERRCCTGLCGKMLRGKRIMGARSASPAWVLQAVAAPDLSSAAMVRKGGGIEMHGESSPVVRNRGGRPIARRWRVRMGAGERRMGAGRRHQTVQTAQDCEDLMKTDV